MDPLLMEGFEKGGFVTFGLAEGGFAYVMSKQPVRSIGDMQKQKFWVPDNDASSVDLVRAFGVAPIPLPLSDVLTALQTGLINTVVVSPIGALALQWHTQVSHLTDLPLLYLYGVLAVNRESFEGIAPADQALVREIMGRAFQDIDRQNRTDNVMAMEALKKQGVEVGSVAEDQMDAFRTRSSEAIRQMLAMNKISSGIYQTLEKHLADFRASHGRQ
jgi:TRAP-type C4-dicarboxylate transport system substrate-binding protein